MAKPDPKDFLRGIQTAVPYLDLGLRFALAAVLGALGGYWLDLKLSSSPIGLLIGVIFGATAGFINLYRNVMRLTKAEDRARREQGKGTHKSSA
ncbi:AtpZ/AtpI family protein [bacterium]|nr:AtpZ/AtpI family protein [bacterium]